MIEIILKLVVAPAIKSWQIVKGLEASIIKKDEQPQCTCYIEYADRLSPPPVYGLIRLNPVRYMEHKTNG